MRSAMVPASQAQAGLARSVNVLLLVASDDEKRGAGSAYA